MDTLVFTFLLEVSHIASKERDLYIDEVYEIDEKGVWTKRERTDGIWLKNEEIKSIEFFYCDRGGNKNEKK